MEDSFFEREIAWLLREKYNGVESDTFLADKERLAGGEPLAYLIGHTPFGPLAIFLDSHPLIPRVETEFWVEKVVDTLRAGFARPQRILDLCAGSGCIGTYVLHELPSAHIDFAEIDTTHHATIVKNIAVNNLPVSQTCIFGGDLFAEIPQGTRYDLILTNPPYIDATLERTDANVHAHEPHQALYGGTHGMEIINRIIAEAPTYLTPAGTLVIEHEPEQCDAIYSLGTRYGFTTEHHDDQYGVKRYSTLTLTD